MHTDFISAKKHNFTTTQTKWVGRGFKGADTSSVGPDWLYVLSYVYRSDGFMGVF
jgi:hypothetical protein